MGMVINIILLILHVLLRNYRVFLGLLAIGLIVLGIYLMVPFFVEINVFHPLPSCGLYWTYPPHARITGNNTLILRAKEPGTTIRVQELNYLVTVFDQKKLDPESDTEKLSVEYQVAPSSLWSIPPEKGIIRVTTTYSDGVRCIRDLEVAINWWTVALRSLFAFATVVPGSWLLKVVLGR